MGTGPKDDTSYTRNQMHTGSECTPARHVWRRDESARYSPLPASLFCVCRSLRLRDLADGAQCITEYVQVDGTVVAGADEAWRSG
jgi:hypothetical protein